MGQLRQISLKLWPAVIVLSLFCGPLLVYNLAQAETPTYSSTNYGVNEVFMGAGGLNDANSASYSARASLGDITVGNAASSSYQAYGGYTTTTDPYLEFFVNAVNTDLGLLTISAPKVTTATFTVRTYLASGYVVMSNSDPPTNASYTMHNLTSQTGSVPGTEQFGINLAANNLVGIGSFGADPVQIPDASYSFGYATDTYNDSNLFKYVSGDVIARSDSSSGTTQFTISYLYNISTITAGGQFDFVHDLVATSTF
jgi:hypothetical protein